MDKIIKSKLLDINELHHLEEDTKITQLYHKTLLASRYLLPYIVGLGASTFYVLGQPASVGFMNSIVLSLILSVPFSFFAAGPSILINQHLRRTKFKFFRKFKKFSDLQDSYFYIHDKVAHILQDKEAQFVFYHFFDSTKHYIFETNKMNNFQLNLFHFKQALESDNLAAAADIFLQLYPQSIRYIDLIGENESSQYDKDMLIVQNKLISEYIENSFDTEQEIEISHKKSSKLSKKNVNWNNLINK